MRPAFFFDRDGTLNEERGYVHRWEQFRWCPGAVGAIKELNVAGILVVVVSNQAGVAHGYYTEAHVQALHARMNADLERHRAWIDAFYYCPHHPVAAIVDRRSDCQCRKPKPGMINRAIMELSIDHKLSVVIGDRETDLQAGAAAGIPTLKLVGKLDDRHALVRHLVRIRRSDSPPDRSRPEG